MAPTHLFSGFPPATHIHRPSPTVTECHRPPPPVSTSTVIMSSRPAAPWISIELGRALNAVTLEVPNCPSVFADVHEKSRAFDAAQNAISAHLKNFDFAELSSCLSQHVPGSHTFSAHQVLQLEKTSSDAPFTITNLTAIGFFDGTKQAIDTQTALQHITLRPANLAFF